MEKLNLILTLFALNEVKFSFEVVRTIKIGYFLFIEPKEWVLSCGSELNI